MRRRTKAVLAVGTAVAVVALGVGIGLWVSSSGTTSTSGTAGRASYATLWREAVAGKTRMDVLRRWPKPYQHYVDGNANDCYEWEQKPVKLYNLCFKHGVLQTKSLA
jgi:hypothetical protein